MMRQVFNEGRQCLAIRSISDYFSVIWNTIDIGLLGFYCATVVLYLLRDLWWCKQAAAVEVLLAYLKYAQFFQAFPGLGRLVQLKEGALASKAASVRDNRYVLQVHAHTAQHRS